MAEEKGRGQGEGLCELGDQGTGTAFGMQMKKQITKENTCVNTVDTI